MKSFKAEALSRLTHLLYHNGDPDKDTVIRCMLVIADIPEEYSMMHRKSDGYRYNPPVPGRSSGRYPWANNLDDEEQEENFEEDSDD